MAKMKPGQKDHQARQKKTAKMPQETPEELYAAAIALAEQSQPDAALEKASTLYAQVQNDGTAAALPALNLLGEISLELGDADGARAWFEKAVVLDPEGAVPEPLGGGAEKFLWLAQLCEEGGQASVRWFERGVKALRGEIAGVEAREGAFAGLEEEALLVMRVEKKRRLANALCGIVEVYMTDLSWEGDAEAKCEQLVTQAMAVEDETSSEVLQTLASVRLSQERKEDARAALRRSLEGWQDADPEDAVVPEFPTRISLARLLMEAEMEGEALEVLERLVKEDDQSVEAWYLGGWCQHLIAEKEKAGLAADKLPIPEGDDSGASEKSKQVDAAMKGSRQWLKMSLKLSGLLEYEDDRLCDHAKELVAGLDAVLGPEDEQAEGGDEWEDEWDGIEDDDDDESEQLNGKADAEMKDA